MNFEMGFMFSRPQTSFINSSNRELRSPHRDRYQ